MQKLILLAGTVLIIWVSGVGYRILTANVAFDYRFLSASSAYAQQQPGETAGSYPRRQDTSESSYANPVPQQQSECIEMEQRILAATVRLVLQRWIKNHSDDDYTFEGGSISLATIKDTRYLVTHNHHGITLSSTEDETLIKAFGHVVSKKTFSKIDHLIWQKLWRWAKRRHRNKPTHWIKQKYFNPPNQEGRRWQFFGQTLDQHRHKHQVGLVYASQTLITRHPKIKTQANPYDPQWETYFEQRLDTKTVNDLRGKRKLLHLWQSQQGLCPLCQQKITSETGWHRHHLIWRVHGGKDTFENQVLLHSNCHRQLHSQGLTVVKPRPSPGV
ncbi:MAG: hypothetical protein BroJett011_77750 [Chloroflexota bacterium]|nr:MAG: hypothetical protein BroJett011_77750 [Chloroflexota bacterium]